MFDYLQQLQRISKTINHLIEIEMRLAVVAVVAMASASKASGFSLVCIN
jgi:hypothetical protein